MAKRAANDGSVNFTGRWGRKRLLNAVKAQTLIAGSVELAQAVIKAADLIHYECDEVLMQQGEPENDIHLIVTGEVAIRVNGRLVATRGAGTHVGEMALVDAVAKRSATVVAMETTIALRLPEHKFTQIATQHPDLWRRVAVEIAKRLRERSKFLPQPHNEPVLFIGSSTEGQAIANDVYTRFRHKQVVPKPWSEGVFQASRTVLPQLEMENAFVR